MKTAFVYVPPLDEYPHAEIRAGLERAGFVLRDDLAADVLVTWTPWAGSPRASMQREFEATRRPVVVIENGWLNPIAGEPYFQVALGGWNGGGRYLEGVGPRWDGWNVPLAPWTRSVGAYQLVIGQRGHPTDRRTAPPNWHETVDVGPGEVLRRGRYTERPLLEDILGASCVHVWSSNAASWAICLGVPVVRHSDHLMTRDMTSTPAELLYTGDRIPHLQRLAWAQWSMAELAAGNPFGLLRGHGLL